MSEVSVLVADPMSGDSVDEQLIQQLADRARAEGLKLTGEGGLLQRLTKVVVESALDGEMDDHLGYRRHDPAGRDGGNSRNGKRPKTLLTEAGPVDIEVPRDRDASFEPRIVAKRQRRLTGVDDLVISLSAKGLTHGEISAHLAEVYGAEVSKQTISTITDRVLDGLAEWQSRPLDAVYPVIFIDAINVKIRDGQVANRPIYVVLAVTVDGTRDILGLWAGEHGDGEGAKFWLRVLSSNQEPRHPGLPDRGVRRAQGSAGCHRAGVAADGRPDMHRAPAQELLQIRLEEGLGGGREGPETGVQSAVGGGRVGPVRRVQRHLGTQVPGDRAVVDQRVGQFVPFLQFDTEIRSIICTTNAIESLNARIRRAVNARGHFPTEQAAMKCVYLAIMSLDPTGKGRQRWSNRWKAALNAFEITFDGRLSAGRK